jgi:asparagine synthase (glutamine-hydrolysing)
VGARVTRGVAGGFGADAAEAGAAARRSLGPSSDGLVEGPLALAWTGDGPQRGDPTLLLSGRVRNLAELASELGMNGEQDPERVLTQAFVRWEEGMLERLRGGFVIVAWDRSKQAGLVAVDQLGVGSLFLHETPGRISFATETCSLAGLLPARPPPDPLRVAQWLIDGYMGRGETLLAGIRRLEGGHLLRLERGSWRQVRYWSPRYAPPVATTPGEAAELVTGALTRAVGKRVADDGPTGVLLSGGLDSSTIAAVASRLDPPRSTRTYSLVHPEHAGVDESSLIALVTQSLELPSDVVTIRDPVTLPAALEYQRIWALPSATPMLAFTLPLLRRAASDGVRVILDGEGGDELFGCSPYLIADRLRRGRLRSALALAQRLPDLGDDLSRRELWWLLRDYGVKGAVPYGVHRSVKRLPERRGYARQLLTPRSATLYLEAIDRWSWKQLDGPRWWAFLAHLLTTTGEMVGYDYFRHRAALAGVESGHPLLDDLDLVELVLRLPPELAFDPALTRPLLRRAVSGLLPDEIRLRREKVDFSVLVVEALTGPDRPLVEELLLGPDTELVAYVVPERIRSLLATPLDRRHGLWARLVWRLATTESWLRSQADPDFPRDLLERHGHSISDVEPSAPPPRRAPTS